MNPKIDTYFAEGCGRCELYQTPQCKVHSYVEPMEHLRRMLLETELQEDYKWKQPTYTLNDKNVLILTAFKDYCCLAFFKGSLMKDPGKVMVTPGENSQAARQLRFTKTDQVKKQEKLIRAYIQEAIELEKSGAKVDFKQKDELEFPEELIQKMDEDPSFKHAFEKLTPGRQRSWNLHFSSAKQSATRSSRIEKAKTKIFEGKGWNER
ncbi:MAG: YdeI/OmpD-associated family protein [Ekhidna sp.]|uniref:YdeI/OmpD-associated family protein n=1 Tax=Ekhidna sp. TaxID=2608089 RepID=UPI0032EB396B